MAEESKSNWWEDNSTVALMLRSVDLRKLVKDDARIGLKKIVTEHTGAESHKGRFVPNTNMDDAEFIREVIYVALTEASVTPCKQDLLVETEFPGGNSTKITIILSKFQGILERYMSKCVNMECGKPTKLVVCLISPKIKPAASEFAKTFSVLTAYPK